MNMRNNAEYIGSSVDGNGIPCRYYINWLTGIVYKAYSLGDLEKREATNQRRDPDKRPTAFHKRGKR